MVEERQGSLTDEQQVVLDKVMSMVDSGEGGMLFLDAPGGTGKTFLLNTILAKVRLVGKIALASASSGIAATLLVGGKTAHTTFGIPLKLQHIESPTSSVGKGTNHAEMLKQASLIVIDECSALHRKGYEVIDDLLQDLTNSTTLFGGIPVLLAGDFRQTLPGLLSNNNVFYSYPLPSFEIDAVAIRVYQVSEHTCSFPVVQRGNAAMQLGACLKASKLWSNVQILSLKKNMRAHITGDVNSSHFAAKLLKIGNGNVQEDSDGYIQIPEGVGSCVSSLDMLRKKVYPDLNSNIHNREWAASRAILAPKNCTVRSINEALLAELNGRERVYYSMDTLEDGNEDQGVLYSPDVLNGLELSGIPSHKVTLKLGAVVMLMRNMGKFCAQYEIILRNIILKN